MIRSVVDHGRTVQARFMQTMDRIEKIEFATNELEYRIERAMPYQAEMTNIFFTKIDQMSESHSEITKRAANLHSDIKLTKDIAKERKYQM